MIKFLLFSTLVRLSFASFALVRPGHTLVETGRNTDPLVNGEWVIVSKTPTNMCAYTKLQESCSSYGDISIGNHAFSQSSSGTNAGKFRRLMRYILSSRHRRNQGDIQPTPTPSPAGGSPISISPTPYTRTSPSNNNPSNTGGSPNNASPGNAGGNAVVTTCGRIRNQALCSDGSDRLSYGGATVSYMITPSDPSDVASREVSTDDAEDLTKCFGVCTDTESGQLVFPGEDSDLCTPVQGWYLVNADFAEPCSFIRKPCQVLEISPDTCEDTVLASYNIAGKYYLADEDAMSECDEEEVDIYRPVWFQKGDKESSFFLFFRSSRWYLNHGGCNFGEFDLTRAYFGEEADLQPHLTNDTTISCYDGTGYEGRGRDREFKVYSQTTDFTIQCIQESAALLHHYSTMTMYLLVLTGALFF